jgi:hypothetical protein
LPVTPAPLEGAHPGLLQPKGGRERRREEIKFIIKVHSKVCFLLGRATR